MPHFRIRLLVISRALIPSDLMPGNVANITLNRLESLVGAVRTSTKSSAGLSAFAVAANAREAITASKASVFICYLVSGGFEREFHQNNELNQFWAG